LWAAFGERRLTGDGLRSGRDLFTSANREKSEHSIDIPKKTLILLPGIHSYALRWSLGKAGDRDGMQICGQLQATNTSKFNIRAAGIKLLEPADVEVLIHMVSVKDPKTGGHSYEHFIRTRSISELSFMLFVVPVRGILGRHLVVTISITDQFGNEHVVRNLECKYVGPEKLL
jgi:hypothetical protein